MRIYILYAFLLFTLTCSIGQNSLANSWLYTDEYNQEKQYCLRQAKKIEENKNIPDFLLQAMVYTESGIRFSEKSGYQTWPWAVQSVGSSYFPTNKQQAISIAKQKIKNGQTNVDMGCLQINWHWHKQAFHHIEDLFIPEKNIAYAAQYLKKLYKRHGSWEKAVKFYHSSNPERQNFYAEKIFYTQHAMQIYSTKDPVLDLIIRHANLKRPSPKKKYYK